MEHFLAELICFTNFVVQSLNSVSAEYLATLTPSPPASSPSSPFPSPPPGANLYPSHSKLSVRMGLHIGPLMGTVLDVARPLYDVFGDTVNTAARLTTNSPHPNCLHISEDIRQLLLKTLFQDSSQITLQISGPHTVPMKGKEPMRTWTVKTRPSNSAEDSAVVFPGSITEESVSYF
eukprot:TRINITY_DN62488_c0_g2_i1.p1 TRINITY_DN62488_c0_g2~~TRINITY_DN62488_c0_g2_i1.p1  ORF type:complete len:177 (-),score=15.29 TRINITY_DN62488_c0_g2_i1:64-594(-)